MTAITNTSVAIASREHPMNRIVAVARLHFANRWSMFALPSIILGSILAMNVIIWYLILASVPAAEVQKTSKGFSYSGAVFFIFIYMLVIAVQAVSRTFPFALGFGVTRRNFCLGSSLAFVVQTFLFSVGLTALSVIEDATDGWGTGGRMFNPQYFANTAIGIRFLMYFFLFLFFVFVGSALAAVYVRWRSTGMVVFFVIVAILLIGGVAIATLGHLWGALAAWIVATGQFGILSWGLVPAAIAAVAGYFILMRATPKN